MHRQHKQIVGACIISILFCILPISSPYANPYVKAEVGVVKTSKYKDYTPGIKGGINGAVPPLSIAKGIGVGYKFENMRFDLSFTETSHKFQKSHVEIDHEAEAINASREEYLISEQHAFARLKVRSKVLMLNGYYDFKKLFKNFIPYVGAGVGVAFNKSSDYILTSYEDVVVFPKSSKTSLAWTLVMGTQTDINEKFSYDISIKYFNYGRSATKPQLYQNGKLIGNYGVVGTKLSGVMITFGLIYKF